MPGFGARRPAAHIFPLDRNFAAVETYSLEGRSILTTATPPAMKLPLLAVLFSSAAVLGHAAVTPMPLPRSTPEAEGIASSAILNFVEGAEQNVHALHSFMLVRHGRVVAEGWWTPYAADVPHEMYSLSKSFTSTAVGLAISEGKLSLDDPIIKFFPDKVPADPGKNLQAMRVRDLLCMSSGQHEDAIKDFPFDSQEDLVKTFLALPVAHKPGTLFVYNTPGSYILSAIVQKVTGQTTRDYLQSRLFEPLGIVDPVWDASAQGVSLGGYGLNLHTEDIAHFGQMLLQKGQWQGRQLVPAAWVETATARQTSNGSEPTSDWDQGYGYQFWRCRHGFFRGDGAFGQFCIVMPQYDAVFVATSGTRDMGSVMNLVWDRILPAFKDAPLPADPSAARNLAAKFAHLELPTPDGAATSPTTLRVVGQHYAFAKNPQQIEWLALDPPQADGTQSFTVKFAWAPEQHLVASHAAWRKATFAGGPLAGPIAAAGAWTTDNTYTLEVARYHTPFIMTYVLKFSGGELELTSEQNVGFDAAIKPLTIIGKAE